MVTIFTGSATGLARGSGSVPGGILPLCLGTQARSGEQLFLDTATGNLLISRNDEYLVGRGPTATPRPRSSCGLERTSPIAVVHLAYRATRADCR